jgi:hypothetical protein
MTAPRVSVVTPFYNTAPYLAECIESVLAQSHGDFEYILVDNHSDDGGGAIAARYAALDRRLRVVSPPSFLAQVPNYNFGPRQIAPDTRYCKIVRPTIRSSALPHRDGRARRGPPSIGVISAYRLFGAESAQRLSHDRTFFADATPAASCSDGIYLFGSPTTVMFRADLARGRDPFAEGRFFEDAEICFDLWPPATTKPSTSS